MSAEASGWVWKHAPVKSGELVVLLALADNAHDDGTGAYPSRAHLATKSRMTERQVGRCLASLEEKGLIRRQGETRGGVVIWAIAMGGDILSGGTSVSPGGGHQCPPEPSSNRPGLDERADAPGEEMQLVAESVEDAPWKVDKKRVPEELRLRAVAVLDHYNQRTGRRLRPVTGRGRPSESAKRIVSRLFDRPDLQADDLFQIVDNVLANPPRWCDGETPDVGDIFGPNAFERALTNTGNRTPKPADQGREDLKARADAAWLRLMGEEA